jgi:hypothetical protein
MAKFVILYYLEILVKSVHIIYLDLKFLGKNKFRQKMKRMIRHIFIIFLGYYTYFVALVEILINNILIGFLTYLPERLLFNINLDIKNESGKKIKILYAFYRDDEDKVFYITKKVRYLLYFKLEYEEEEGNYLNLFYIRKICKNNDNIIIIYYSESALPIDNNIIHGIESITILQIKKEGEEWVSDPEILMLDRINGRKKIILFNQIILS